MAKQQLSIWGNGDSEGRTDGPMAACTLSGGPYLMQPQLHISSWWGAKQAPLLSLSLSPIPAKCDRAAEELRLPAPSWKSVGEARLPSRARGETSGRLHKFVP